MSNPRQIAFKALQNIYRRSAYTDVALAQVLRHSEINSLDRGLLTELVYGIVRRQRTLDSLIDQLCKKKAEQQPPDLRIILQIGLYQLRYLSQVPPSASVNTTVELAKVKGFKSLSGLVNGVLRQYIRLTEKHPDPLELPADPVKRLGVLYSFPDWIVQLWLEQFTQEETEKLCQWFNQPPTFDLRINPLKTTIEEVESALGSVNVKVSRLPNLPQGLRLIESSGPIQKLPGFSEGWWTIQDSSAQLVTYLLDPQPGETIIDACAAPGGKTTQIAELMGDLGTIWACDRAVSRLRQVEENAQRLQLKSLQICQGDSRSFPQFTEIADRVLLDAPCSGLGTLHKRPDIRWRQTPERIGELCLLQRELLEQTATWVKPKGILVYATCTLNPVENEEVIQTFLDSNPDWQIVPPTLNSPLAALATTQGWLKVLPHEHQMDGFFMVKLKRGF